MFFPFSSGPPVSAPFFSISRLPVSCLTFCFHLQLPTFLQSVVILHRPFTFMYTSLITVRGRGTNVFVVFFLVFTCDLFTVFRHEPWKQVCHFPELQQEIVHVSHLCPTVSPLPLEFSPLVFEFLFSSHQFTSTAS